MKLSIFKRHQYLSLIVKCLVNNYIVFPGRNDISNSIQIHKLGCMCRFAIIILSSRETRWPFPSSFNGTPKSKGTIYSSSINIDMFECNLKPRLEFLFVTLLLSLSCLNPIGTCLAKR